MWGEMIESERNPTNGRQARDAGPRGGGGVAGRFTPAGQEKGIWPTNVEGLQAR